MSTIHRPTAKSLALITILAAACFAQTLTKEYVRLGGRVIAIENGFGVTVTKDLATIGPGQYALFTVTPSEPGVGVSCNAPVGASCVLDSGPDYRWKFTAPMTPNTTSTVTVTATLNGQTKNTNVEFTIAGAAQDTLQMLVSRPTGVPAFADAKPGEAGCEWSWNNDRWILQ